MHFSRRIVDRDASGLLLFLLFRIIGREVRRDPIPGLTVVARTEQKLRANINGPLFIGAHVNWSVPVKAQLLLTVFGKRLDGSYLVGVAVDAPDLAALGFRVNIGWIGRVFEHPKTIAIVHIFPARIADATGV